MQMGQSRQGNVERALEWVEQAAQAEAKIVLLPELFEGVYFPQTEEEHYFDWAHPFDLESHPFLSRFQDAAKQLGVVLPVSFFEKAGPSYYNSLCVFDADGANLGLYRKAHIPDGPSYEEKFYFSPGNTPPRVFKTRFGSVGIGICWDQWFPELARLLTLQGADILLYPTAIGSEPPAAGELETRKMWRRAMVGHAVCNAIPVVAANRMGAEGAMQIILARSCVQTIVQRKVWSWRSSTLLWPRGFVQGWDSSATGGPTSMLLCCSAKWVSSLKCQLWSSWWFHGW
jgi:N-carbamoylputrescine amidase